MSVVIFCFVEKKGIVRHATPWGPSSFFFSFLKEFNFNLCVQIAPICSEDFSWHALLLCLCVETEKHHLSTT